MRLVRATVRQYRIHRDVTVEFDPHLTVLGGPNEAGKSTLVEAIHRVLFLGHRTTGALRDAMLSHDGGIPEVELHFAIGDLLYRLRKRFNGQMGSADLEVPDGTRWRGDAAEEQLAELLREPNAPGGRGSGRVEGRWEHVWVFQGQATGDPIERTASQHETLIQRLQEIGGGALVQSARDGEVAKRVEQAYARVWTDSGKVRRDAELSQALKHVADARRDLSEAEQRRDQLDDAERHLDAANARLAERASEGLHRLLAQHQDAVRQLEALEGQLTLAQEKVARAQFSVDEFANRCDSAEEVERALTDCQGERTALDNRLAHATADAQAAQERVEATEHELRGLQGQSRDARRTREALQKQADLARAERDLAATRGLLREVQQRREERADAEQQFAGLPRVDADVRNRLAELELACAKAEAALEAMVTRLELLSTDSSVSVDGTPLMVGEPRVLTRDVELRIGDGTTLRLSPGGGGSVRDAQREAATTRQALADALADVGVTSVRAAEEILRQRETLFATLAAAEMTLRVPQYAQAEATLAELQSRVQVLTAERDAARDAVLDLPNGDDIDALLPAAAERERQLEDQIVAVNAVLDAQRESLTLRRRAADALRDERAGENTRLAALEARVTSVMTEIGNADLRADRRQQLARVVDAAQDELKRIERNTDELRAADPKAAVERLGRALQVAEAQEREAETQRAVALERLRSDGVSDPTRHVADANAAVARAERTVDAEQLRADAFKLLRTEFAAAQEDLAERYAAPLQAKVEEYLRPIFGAGVGVGLAVQQDRFESLSLRRTRGQFKFGQLSGGTKEQVSVAFRLAMAEILAAGFDDTLPVVLDDAFAYADPARLQGVHGMLNRAARNGVQVIVLTCTPADYVALGGHFVDLQASVPSIPGPSPVAPKDDTARLTDIPREATPLQQPAEHAPSQSGTLEAQALELLRSRGGSMGNHSLCEQLGLGAEAYEELKQQLLAAGRVRRGRGRGGTLTLVE